MSDDATSAVPISLALFIARYERAKERKREYMARRYADPEFRALKCADATRRYHERVPAARWGIRGRLPKQAPEPAVPAVLDSSAQTADGHGAA